MNVTTVTLWVCSCGRVMRIDGGQDMANARFERCPNDTTGYIYHRPTPVLVVVPIP